MRLGRWEISRRVTAAAPAGKTPSSPHGAQGASGTISSDGFIQSAEYNPALTGRRGMMQWQRMRMSDASVREALWHIFAPIINATWNVEAASDDPLDLEVAEFGRRCLHDWMIEPASVFLRTALLYLPQGFQVFEVVEHVVEAELTYDVPMAEPVTTPKRQFVVWRHLAHRRPETIWKWNVKGGELQGIQQMVMDDGRMATPTIDARDLIVFVNEKEGDDFQGMSLLRSSYKAFQLKEIVEKVAGMAYERHGVGVPVGYLPEAMKNDQQALERLENMLKDLRAGQYTYLAFPGPKASQNETGRDGYLVEILSPANSIPDFLPFLEYLRGEIKGNVLARFAELGHGSVGARSTGDVQSQVWYDALQGTANYVAAVLTDALERLIDKNYSVEDYPRVVAHDIEARNILEFADATSKLVASGAALPDSALRGAVRDFMGWPDEDEAEVEDMLEDETEPEEDPPSPDDDEPDDVDDDPASDDETKPKPEGDKPKEA